MVLNTKSRWEPFIHRFGQKFDHDLLSAIWRWKTRKTEKQKHADYAAMDSQSWQTFDTHLRIKLQDVMETRAREDVTDVEANIEDVTDTCVRKGTANLQSVCKKQSRK